MKEKISSWPRMPEKFILKRLQIFKTVTVAILKLVRIWIGG